MSNIFPFQRSHCRKPAPSFSGYPLFSAAPFLALALGTLIAGSLFLHVQQSQQPQGQVEHGRVLPIP